MIIRSLSTRIITNPFFLYAISFIVVLCSFSLKWSDYYRTIGEGLLSFIAITSLIAILLGLLPQIKKKNVFRSIPVSPHNKQLWRCIVSGYVLEFIYCRSIPFVSIIFNGIGGYRDFEGIPMFHVLLSNISLFWGIYVFLQFQSNRHDKRLKRYVWMAYIPHILLLNRGAIIQLLFSSIFIWLLRIGRLSFKKILYFVAGAFCFLMLFGIMGDARDANSQKDETYILRIGGATDEFIESNIPKALFWGYMYTASPLGNVQNAIDHATPHLTWDNFRVLLMESCCPDFIAKRLLQVVPPECAYDIETYMVTPIFNAPTVYYQPYLRLGWIGMIWMFGFMVFVVFAYIYLVSSRSVFFLVGWSSMLSTIALNTFNNMWFFGGLTIITLAIVATLYHQIKQKLQDARQKHSSVGFRNCSDL